MVTGPDFVVAGGHKCATTSLHFILASHPSVAMSSAKEPHYLAKDALEGRLRTGIWQSKDYAALWEGRSSRYVCGEVSAYYVYFSEQVTQRVGADLQSPPKIIVVVRNPIDRAYSAYCDTRLKDPDEQSATFDDAVALQLSGDPLSLSGAGSPGLRHLALGIYSTGIQNFSEQFGAANVHVVDFDDVRRNLPLVLLRLQAFIGVPEAANELDTGLRNPGQIRWRDGLASSVARSRLSLHGRRLLRQVAPSIHGRLKRAALVKYTRPVDQMGDATRAALTDLYRPEIDRLQDLLHKDLSHWIGGS